MTEETKERTFQYCRKYEDCTHYHLNERGIDACKLKLNTWSGHCNNFTPKEKLNTNSKKKVLQIIKKRQNYIQKVCRLIKSDGLMQDSRKLSNSFITWLVEKKIIVEYVIKKTERKPETKKERKWVKVTNQKIIKKKKIDTDEFKLLKGIYIDSDNIIFSFWFSPQIFQGKSMIKLNSNLWTKAKKIIDIILPYIPIYIENHYKEELNRLCPLKEDVICEHCGYKNDTCNQFCGECGKKL